MDELKKQAIAIVGLAFRLPGDITTMDALWSALVEGADLVSQIPDERFPHENYSHPRKDEPGKSYTFNAGVLSKIHDFDANFFGISPREASQIDPEQRILLETTWEALENGGQNIDKLAGQNCGVFIGAGSHEHMFKYVNDNAIADSYTMLGSCSSIASNRISYVFDLHGPSLSVDTACSSSLVALDLACRSIWNKETSMAIAGGINLLQSPIPFIGFSKASMLSPDGRCKSFSAAANGYVRSEGCIVLFLKALEEAEKNGDPIHAVILNSGVNSDGRTKSIILPDGDSQAELILKVHQEIGLSAEELHYIEAHGTGTLAGDKAESHGLAKALSTKRPKNKPLLIGSIKSNMGHLEVASGLAGLLKTILALKYRSIPKTLHYTKPNPEIAFESLNLKVVDKFTILEENEIPLTVAVNSFGFGGTNAHVVLREYKQKSKDNLSLDKHCKTPPLLLSYHHEQALPLLVSQYLKLLEDKPEDYYDIAYTLSHHRALHAKGFIVTGDSLTEIIQNLKTFLENKTTPSIIQEQRRGNNLELALVYSGNGCQWQGMGIKFLEEPSCKATLIEIDKIFSKFSDFSVLDELKANLEQSRLEATEVSQPCLFALQVAYTRYLLDQGIQFQAVTGHSVGEIAAAWAAGILSLEQATEVIFKRSFWQGKTKGRGRMLALSLDVNEVEGLIARFELSKQIEIAAINSPSSVTLAGELDGLCKIQGHCEENNIFCRLLSLDYAFHSQAMDDISQDLQVSLKNLAPKAGSIPFISTVTGSILSGGELDANYWWDNIRKPVLFNEAIDCLTERGISLFIEVGAHPILKPYIEEHFRFKNKSCLVIPTNKRQNEEANELEQVIHRAWLSGAKFNTEVFFPIKGQIKPMPAYPMIRETYRLLPSIESANQLELSIENSLLGRRIKASETIWENHLDPQKLTYLQDHQVDGAMIMPAAGFVEMALAAAKETYEHQYYELKDIDILAAMVFEKDYTRLVRFELANSGDFVIKSCRRLEEDAWVTHVLGRILIEPLQFSFDPFEIEAFKMAASFQESGQALYLLAKTKGLDYGPSFQNVDHLWGANQHCLASTFIDKNKAYLSKHCLFPGLLDSCFQLLFSQFLTTDRKSLAYLPIRIGRLQFVGTLPSEIYLSASLIDRSKHTLRADFSIQNGEGEVIAKISDCRFKCVDFSAKDAVKYYETKAFLLNSFHKEPAFSIETALFCEKLQSTHNLSSLSKTLFETMMPLIDLLISCFVYEAIFELTKGQSFSLTALLHQSEIVLAQQPYLNWCIELLLEDDLLNEDNANYSWTLLAEPLPNAFLLWQMLINDYPDFLQELTIIGRVGIHLKSLFYQNENSFNLRNQLYKNSLNCFLGQSLFLKEAGLSLYHAVESLMKDWPLNRKIRVLDLSFGFCHLSKELVNFFASKNSDYEIFTSTEVPQEFIFQYPFVKVNLINSENLIDLLVTKSSFDLILVHHGLQLVNNIPEALEQLRLALAPKGLLILQEQYSERLHEFTLGINADWWLNGDKTYRKSPFLPMEIWQHYLQKTGFSFAKPLFKLDSLRHEGAFVLITEAEVVSVKTENHERAILDEALMLVANQDKAGDLRNILKLQVSSLSLFDYQQANFKFSEDEPLLIKTFAQKLKLLSQEYKKLHLVWFCTDTTIDEHVNTLTALICLIKASESIDWPIQPKITVITLNAQPAEIMGQKDEVNPIQAMLWGVCRVISNEYPRLSLKLIDLADELSIPLLTYCMEEIFREDNEKEIILTAHSRFGLRVLDSKNKINSYHQAAYLDFKKAGSLNNLEWFYLSPKPLAPHEILVKPHASGLNFRDLMYVMGLIPDEAVESGFLGANLGMEFAGEVTATGSAIANFQVGDKVLGFAPASFGSLAITTEEALMHLPPLWDYHAAATVPIAFFTAYYAIHHLARLVAGERILIHGAAGAVGLAAIQLAKHLKAEIWVTAGSVEKRDFLKLMGVRQVYDSRSLAFADEIMKNTANAGVDVVLNCLAGEAINANLSLLKPFGRFLELGKRDFFANSKIGLRPFRNNISYFGIDADQLLIKKPALCKRLFSEMMSLFNNKELMPLPFSSFKASNIVDAFRCMQQSRHIGKITIDMTAVPCPTFSVDAKPSLLLSAHHSYLITGGLKGFGLETAKWLVKHGAKHLVLVGRQGLSAKESIDAIKELEEKGISIRVHALDVTKEEALIALITSIQQSKTPLKGLIHAAALYEDALIQNLNFEKMERVLMPKVLGAFYLHKHTQSIPLDFFVVYSSISTLFGNPGQANYVAANAYLESLILQRRSQGLKGTYAAFGPIEDVGYLARNEVIKNRLKNKLGDSVLTAKKALSSLEELLHANKGGIAIADLNISKMKQIFKSLESAKFAHLVKKTSSFDDINQKGKIDIRSLLGEKKTEEIIDLMNQILAEEIAKILKLNSAKIDCKEPLSNLGLDSLVGSEFSHAIEERFSIQIPMMVLSQGLSLNEISLRIIKKMQQETLAENSEASNLIEEAALHGEIISSDLAKILVQEMEEVAGAEG